MLGFSDQPDSRAIRWATATALMGGLTAMVWDNLPVHV